MATESRKMWPYSRLTETCSLGLWHSSLMSRGDQRSSHVALFRTILSKWIAHVTFHFDREAIDAVRISAYFVRPFDESSVIYLHCIDLSTEKFTPVTSFPYMEICCVLGHFSFPRDLAVREEYLHHCRV